MDNVRFIKNALYFPETSKKIFLHETTTQNAWSFNEGLESRFCSTFSKTIDEMHWKIVIYSSYS